MIERQCDDCGEWEPEDGMNRCASCGKVLCGECEVWCCSEYDEDCGDWFCEDCAEEASDEWVPQVRGLLPKQRAYSTIEPWRARS